MVAYGKCKCGLTPTSQCAKLSGAAIELLGTRTCVNRHTQDCFYSQWTLIPIPVDATVFTRHDG